MKGTVAVIILLSFSQEQAEPAGIQVPLAVLRAQQGRALAAQGTVLCHPRAAGSARSVPEPAGEKPTGNGLRTLDSCFEPSPYIPADLASGEP